MGLKTYVGISMLNTHDFFSKEGIYEVLTTVTFTSSVSSSQMLYRLTVVVVPECDCKYYMTAADDKFYSYNLEHEVTLTQAKMHDDFIGIRLESLDKLIADMEDVETKYPSVVSCLV